MESLVRYKRLLLKNHASTLEEDGRRALEQHCLRLLGQLREYDPQRRRRYDDLGASIAIFRPLARMTDPTHAPEESIRNN